MSKAPFGWSSDFPTFRVAEPRVVRGRLQDFLPNAEASQVRAWDDSISRLQREVGESLDAHDDATEHKNNFGAGNHAQTCVGMNGQTGWGANSRAGFDGRSWAPGGRTVPEIGHAKKQKV